MTDLRDPSGRQITVETEQEWGSGVGSHQVPLTLPLLGLDPVGCGQGMLPDFPVNKECCPLSQFYKNQAISHCSNPRMVHLRGIQDGEKQEAFCALDTDPR